MTLDEAIKHAEEVANIEAENAEWFNLGDDSSEMFREKYEKCKECAEEHRQLAEWLKELKDYKERIPSYEAGYNDAKREIALSGEYERAYERGKQDTEQTRWIPVSERLPKDNTLVLVTIKVGNREPKVRSGYYYMDGHFHIDNGDSWESRDKELLAWMPLPTPFEPQKSEG